MKNAPTIMSLGFLLLAAAVAGAQQPPPDFATELRLALEKRAQNPQQTITSCDAMLTRYKDPAHVKEILLLKAETLVMQKKTPEAATLITKIQTDFAGDKDVLARAGLIAGDSLRGQGKFPEAAAAYQKVAKDYSDLPERAADALLREGDTRANDQKKPGDGLAAYKAVEAQYSTQSRLAAAAMQRSAVLMETQLKDPAGAAAAYQTLTEKYVSQFDERAQAGNFAKAVEMYRAAGKLPEALDLARKAEKAIESPVLRGPVLLVQPAILTQMKKPADARTEAERIICAYPLELDLCQGAQAQLIESYRSESKFEDALGAARTLFDAAGSEPSIREATAMLAQMFRSMDGNLGRANEFLAYQRFGPAGADGKPGTEDDVKVNHLLAVKYPATTPERDKRFGDAIAAQPSAYDGYRAKAYLSVYWGKPKEAVGFFRQAFRICPDATVPQAANELVLVGVKALTGSFAGLDKVYEFISYGPKGKSGKESIPDPFVGT